MILQTLDIHDKMSHRIAAGVEAGSLAYVVGAIIQSAVFANAAHAVSMLNATSEQHKAKITASSPQLGRSVALSLRNFAFKYETFLEFLGMETRAGRATAARGPALGLVATSSRACISEAATSLRSTP